MTTHPVDDVVRGLDPVPGSALAGYAARPGARALFDEVTSLPPAPRPKAGRPTRRIVSGALATAALVIAAVLGVTLPPSGGGTVGVAAAVEFELKPGYIEARIVDPRTDPRRLRAAFAEHGLDIALTLVPASPSVVGTIVMFSAPTDKRAITVISDPACRTASGADCPIGLRIPLDFHGHVEMAVGRAAAPGEPYLSTNPEDAPQVPRGTSVARTERMLARKGLRVAIYNVQWSLPGGRGYGDHLARSRVDGRWKVTSVEPHTQRTVMLMIEPSGPIPRDVLQKMGGTVPKAAPSS